MNRTKVDKEDIEVGKTYSWFYLPQYSKRKRPLYYHKITVTHIDDWKVHGYNEHKEPRSFFISIIDCPKIWSDETYTEQLLNKYNEDVKEFRKLTRILNYKIKILKKYKDMDTDKILQNALRDAKTCKDVKALIEAFNIRGDI